MKQKINVLGCEVQASSISRHTLHLNGRAFNALTHMQQAMGLTCSAMAAKVIEEQGLATLPDINCSMALDSGCQRRDQSSR